MINILYSLLVSGAHTVPEQFPHYRRYTDVGSCVNPILESTDPYLRSMWANYIIELSKKSPLYPALDELDPSNTYKCMPDVEGHSKVSPGCTIIKVSTKCPVLKNSYSVVYTADADGGYIVTVMTDNFTSYEAEVFGDPENKEYIVDIEGYTIKFQYGIDRIDIDVYNPAVTLPLISKADITKLHKNIPTEIYQAMDLDSVYDRACAFSITLLVSNGGTYL